MRNSLGLLAALLCAGISQAQTTYTWTNAATNWGTFTNWSPAVVPNNLVNSIAAFGPQATPMQPNVAGMFAVRGITFDNTTAGWNLTGSAGNQLATGVNGITWTGGGASLISANLSIAANQTWDVGTTTVTVGGAANTGGLNGDSTLTKTGAGTMIVDTSANLFTGGFVVSQGTLQAGSATNNSSLWALRSNSVNLAGGTNLTQAGPGVVLSFGSLSGSGAVLLSGAGAQLFERALVNATSSATVTALGGMSLYGGNGTTQTFTGNLTGLANQATVSSGATMVLSGTGDTTSGVIGVPVVQIHGGAFALDNSGGNTGAATGRLGNATSVSIGGMLSLIGHSSGTTETVGAWTLSVGSSTVSVTSNSGTGATLAFTDSGSLRNVTNGTVNFVGLGTGGELGSAANAPRITFSGAINANTVNGALSSTGSGATTVDYGWARVNGTGWAGNGANGIFALTEVPRNSATLGSAAINEITTFTPSTPTTTLAGNLGVAGTPLLFKITPSGAGQSLASGGFNINAVAVMLAGNTDFSITGAGSFFGTVASFRYVYVTDANTVLSVEQSFAGASRPFSKSGPGTVFLNGAGNQLAFVGTVQNVNLLEGTLRGTLNSLGGGTSAGGAFTNLNLFGGVLEISGGGTFSRALTATAGTTTGGAISWNNLTDGGFSAIGGNATVTLVTTFAGATPATPTWNTVPFVSDGSALTMGSSKADSTIDFTNSIALDNGTPNLYNGREIRVAKNLSSTTDIARLSGVMSGSSQSDLLKTGAGTLELTNSNTYAGNTQVLHGTLRANNSSGSATGTGNVLVRAGATLGGNGFVVPAAGNAVSIAGTVSPGNSVGTLTFGSMASPTAVAATGHYMFELSTAGASAAADTGGSSALGVHDRITVFGTLSVSGLIIDPISLGVSGFDNTMSYSWTIATATGGITGVPGAVSIGAGTEFAGMTFSESIVGSSLYLNFTPVPEPATVLGIAAAGFGVGGLIRRRFRKTCAA